VLIISVLFRNSKSLILSPRKLQAAMKKSDRYLSNEINNHEAEFLVFEPRFKFELGGSNMVVPLCILFFKI